MSEQADAAGPDVVSVAVRLSGEYDISRQDVLEEQLAAAHDADVAVLDLRDVPYLDSSALSSFIKLRKRMMERGPGIVRIAGASPQVRRIFQLTNLDRIFRIEEEL
jgi:anti-anti-sigma factor